MADLLPTLPSDDDENDDTKNNVDDDDDDDDSSSMIMDESFSLLPDGGVGQHQQQQQNQITGWSFQSAIMNSNNHEEQDPSLNQQIPQRMNIDSIIAAKRKDIIKLFEKDTTKMSKKKEKKDHQYEGNEDNNEYDYDDSETSDDTDDDGDEDNLDSGSDYDNDTETNYHKMMIDSKQPLEDDVLKTRLTKSQQQQLKKEKQQQQQQQQQRLQQATGQSSKGDDDEDADRNDSAEEDEEEEGDSENDDNSDDASTDNENQKEADKANAFFDTETSIAVSNNNKSSVTNNHMTNNANDSSTTIQTFNQLPLCRPLLRGIAAMGFVQPTPIQSAVIPLVLYGRDICASAVTGSGKTAAFVVPITERILHRTSASSTAHSNHSATRALILTPTRELAAQCYSMMSTFIQYTKLRAVLIVGGTKNGSYQATELRTRPDFIVATPGRLLDHITNSIGCTLEDIEFLILDEADRLLDLGFSDEIMEIVKSCPINRQTLLFSATMNTKVDDLIRLSLKNPVRVRITDQQSNNTALSSNDTNIEVAPRLEQEFVRIRASNEGIKREGILLALLTRTYKTQVICFFDTKVMAHRIMIMAGLCGIRCAELHGNLTQPQRLMALEDFRSGNVDVLLATDLAARGLDIDRVQTVINFEMPSQLATYIHRIGRTARAGRSGRSCTLIGEGRRHLMKELLKESTNKKKCIISETSGSTNSPAGTTGIIRSRTVPPAVIGHFAAKLQSLEVHYEEVLQAETVAKLDRIAEMEVTRAQNLIEHADEIKQRPAKEWFASTADKQRAIVNSTKAVKDAGTVDGNGKLTKPTSGMHRMTRKKRRAREVREAMEQGDIDDNDQDDGTSHKSNQPHGNKLTANIKADVRKQKRLREELKNERSGLSINDLDMQEAKKLKKKKQKANSNAHNTTDSIGDGNLFGNETETYSSMSKSQVDKPAKSSYKFIGYNPEKKLGKKKAHKAFKSKSKHKRR